MKELTIEQKALAYDEAVINGSRLWECGEITRENYEYIFPKIKESGDDKIRRAILNTVKYYHFKESPYMLGISQEQVIAWLEKQGGTKDKLNTMLDDSLSRETKETWNKFLDEQKPVWTEEDIKIIERIVCILDGICYYNTVDNKQEKPYQSEIDFLKSLKDRVQPK